MPEPAAPYLQPYRDAEQRHGSDFAVTMWARPETQTLRFKVFTQCLNLRDKRLLDAGCARGDLAEYLIQRGVDYAHYHGVDGLDNVVAFARTRGLPRTTFAAGDFVTDATLLAEQSPDVTLLSGTLNTMPLDVATRVLDHAWAGCREALAFNFLADTAGPNAVPQQYPAHRLPTHALLDWAFAQTPYVAFRQDYFRDGHDATIVMHHQLPDATTASKI